MLFLCLRRLHIPVDITNFIISLDKGDRIFVRSPWLLDQLRKAGAVNPEETFSTEKGIAQGDISSPPLWVAAFDVPLTALSVVKSGFKVLDLCNLAVEVTDIAYADDLFSIVATPEALQDKADIMSA
jgi:hypothetical protein